MSEGFEQDLPGSILGWRYWLQGRIFNGLTVNWPLCGQPIPSETKSPKSVLQIPLGTTQESHGHATKAFHQRRIRCFSRSRSKAVLVVNAERLPLVLDVVCPTTSGPRSDRENHPGSMIFHRLATALCRHRAGKSHRLQRLQLSMQEPAIQDHMSREPTAAEQAVQ